MPMTCFHCNGYYGSSYDQPICPTCHMFLYADEHTNQDNNRHCHDKVDDGDSGNEEPKETSEPLAGEPREENAQSESPRKLKKRTNRKSTESLALTPEKLNDSSEKNESRVNCCLKDSFDSDSLCVPGTTETAVKEEELTEDMGVNIMVLPPEVMVLIFEKLDEISLWSISQVCCKWNELVRFSLNIEWKTFTKIRWPMFKPLYTVTNWYKTFAALIESAPCQLCSLQIPFDHTPLALENSWGRNRLTGEMKTLRSDPPEGIAAAPLDMMSLHWQASIRGPAASPYQGGTFYLYIRISPTYPLKPPLVRFITKIFHPNVSRHGDIGIDSIQHNWSLALTISKILISIQSLLTDPYTKVCMEPRIGDMYDNNRVQFDRIAKAWTWKYAMHDAIDPDTMVPDFLQKVTSDPEKFKQEAETTPSES